MSRIIVFVGVSVLILLVGIGCGPESTEPVPQQPIVQIEPAPTESNAVSELKPAETAKEQVKPEEVTKAEPNVQPTAIPEPNEQKPVIIEPAAQKPAESNSVEPKTATEAKTANELCDKCTAFFSKYVDTEGNVNYRLLSHKKLELLEILDNFKTLDRGDYNSWPRDDKIAFWINAYNLELTKIILDNYPIQTTRILLLFWPPNSIRHIKGIWDEHKFIIMDEEFTPREIEQRFFSGEFGEPRVFLAISYASASGPPLRNEAYRGKDLSRQLDDQAKKFLAGKQGFKIDRQGGIVHLSSILKSSWNGEKFIAKYGTDLKFKQQEPAVKAVLNFLTKYISQPDVEYLETGNYSIEYMYYDWTLNEHAGQ